MEILVTFDIISNGEVVISRNEAATCAGMRNVPVVLYSVLGRHFAEVIAYCCAVSLKGQENANTKKSDKTARVSVELNYDGKVIKGEAVDYVRYDVAASFYSIAGLAICRVLNNFFYRNHDFKV